MASKETEEPRNINTTSCCMCHSSPRGASDACGSELRLACTSVRPTAWEAAPQETPHTNERWQQTSMEHLTRKPRDFLKSFQFVEDIGLGLPFLWVYRVVPVHPMGNFHVPHSIFTYRSKLVASNMWSHPCKQVFLKGWHDLLVTPVCLKTTGQKWRKFKVHTGLSGYLSENTGSADSDANQQLNYNSFSHRQDMSWGHHA